MTRTPPRGQRQVWTGAVILVAGLLPWGCVAPQGYRCETSQDCAPTHTCVENTCVRGTTVDAGASGVVGSSQDVGSSSVGTSSGNGSGTTGGTSLPPATSRPVTASSGATSGATSGPVSGASSLGSGGSASGGGGGSGSTGTSSSSSSSTGGLSITGLTPRLYPLNPLPAGDTLSNTLGLSDGNLTGVTWRCVVDRHLDGVETGTGLPDCTTLPGTFTLGPSGVLSWRTPLDGHGAYELLVTAQRPQTPTITAALQLDVRPDYPQATGSSGTLVLDVDLAFATGQQPAWGAPLDTVGGLTPATANGMVNPGARTGFVGSGTPEDPHRLVLDGSGAVVFPQVIPAQALVTTLLDRTGSGTALSSTSRGYRVRRPLYANVLQLESAEPSLNVAPNNSGWTNLVTGDFPSLDFTQSTNSATAGWQTGPPRLEFDGNERVLSRNPNRTSWSRATLEVWMRPDRVNTTAECYLQLGDDGDFIAGEGRLAICRDGGNGDALYYKDLTYAGDQQRFGPPLPAGMWHHVVLVLDGLGGGGGTVPTVATAYLNGVPVTVEQPTVRMAVSDQDHISVGSQTNGIRAVDGAVARARVWHAALTPAEVATLFQDKPDTSILDAGMVPQEAALELAWDARLRRPCRVDVSRAPRWVVAHVTTQGSTAGLGLNGVQGCTHALPSSVITTHALTWGASTPGGGDGWTGQLADVRAWSGGGAVDVPQVLVATGARVGALPDVSRDGLLVRLDATVAAQARVPQDGCSDTTVWDSSGQGRDLGVDFRNFCQGQEGWNNTPVPHLWMQTTRAALPSGPPLANPALSIEVLMQPNTLDGWRFVAGMTDGPWTRGWGLSHNDPPFNGQVHPLTLWINDFRNPGPVMDLVPDAWVHVVGTVDSAGMLRLYKNGALLDSVQAAAPLTVSSDPLRLGMDADGEWGVDSAMAYVALYDRPLSAGEVRRHCQAMQLRLGTTQSLACP